MLNSVPQMLLIRTVCAFLCLFCLWCEDKLNSGCSLRTSAPRRPMWPPLLRSPPPISLANTRCSRHLPPPPTAKNVVSSGPSREPLRPPDSACIPLSSPPFLLCSPALVCTIQHLFSKASSLGLAPSCPRDLVNRGFCHCHEYI